MQLIRIVNSYHVCDDLWAFHGDILCYSNLSVLDKHEEPCGVSDIFPGQKI